jgi:multidrug transporter EmrE-like cation transporter
MSLISLILLYLLLSTTGLILIKIGFNQFSFETYHLEEYRRFLKYAYHHPEFIFGFCLYILSFISWLIILSKKQLTFIFPIVTGLAYASIIIASFLFLREEINLFKLIGIVLIGIGILSLIKV